MTDVNISATVGFVMALLSLVAYLYCARKQILQTLVPKDWLTQFRIVILGVLITSVIGLVPVVVYQALRAYGIETGILRDIATVTGNVSRLTTAVLFVLIYRYRSETD